MRTNLRTRIPFDVVIVFSGFTVLGLPSSMLNVAWPSVRATFNLPLDALGALALVSTAGSVLSNLSSGRLQARFGLGPYLALGCATLAVGLTGYALALAWWVMLICGFLVGFGFGAVNPGINTYLATNYGPRPMNWLHASFGLGATVGPLLMTALLAQGLAWQWAYALVAVSQWGYAALFALTRDMWHLGGRGAARATAPAAAAPAPVEAADWRDTLRLPLLWVGIALFFISVGVQATAGQWSYTLFTEGRGVDQTVAGTWAGAYWGCIMAGRVIFGLIGDRVQPVTILRVNMTAYMVGAALFWWNPTDATGFLGLAVMGFALAPFYPLMVLTIPRQLGAAHAANGIGFQVAAGSLGGATVSAFAGVLAARAGLETIGALIWVGTVALLVLHEASRRVAPA